MTDERLLHYVLVGRTPFAVDMLTWAREFQDTDKRRVAYTVLDYTPVKVRLFGRSHTRPKCYVSTVFLGLDHGWGEGEPILFETMIFGGPLSDYQERYCTYAQAEAGHYAAVTQAVEAADKIKAIHEAAHQ